MAARLRTHLHSLMDLYSFGAVHAEDGTPQVRHGACTGVFLCAWMPGLVRDAPFRTAMETLNHMLCRA